MSMPLRSLLGNGTEALFERNSRPRRTFFLFGNWRGVGTLRCISCIFLATFGLMLGALPAPSKPPSLTTINITGSTTVLPLAQSMAEAYMARRPEIIIYVAGTGSGDGIKAVIEGTANIGTSSREVKDKESALARTNGVEIKDFVIALDCIVPVVNPANPIRNLSLAQLGDIYTGTTKRWSELGGWDKPLVAISRDSSSGTFEAWKDLVLAGMRVRPDIQLQASNGAVAQAVAGNKYAIGYVGWAYLHPRITALSVDGIAASPDAVRNRTYPLARGLHMFTAGEPQGAVKSFLAFALGPEGQRIVQAEGFVPVRQAPAALGTYQPKRWIADVRSHDLYDGTGR
jgi:phosphate transport system substrate-binding protein